MVNRNASQKALFSLDLGGPWQVRQLGNQKIPGETHAVVPGCIHSDLLAAGKIEDPFYRDNESRLMWIGESNWLYSRSFEVPTEILEYEHVLLHCAGLDTLATVWINDKKLGHTNNMFRTWEWDIKTLLRAGSNFMKIRFDSPVRFAARKQAKRFLRHNGIGVHRLSGGNWVRKAQSNFGWDWGPRCVTCGIWRPIKVLAFSEGRLSDVHVRQQHSSGSVNLYVSVSAEGTTSLQTAVSVLSPGGEILCSAIKKLARRQTSFRFEITNPQLWWPNGMGSQPLYYVRVELRNGGVALIDTAVRRIGLRTLNLVRKEDQWGESFGFAVNGVSFFAKGANWIPARVFASSILRRDYELLLGSAKEANMNFIRVWGGGIYEPDCLYDLCDEMGLCVWQDFMFACSAYPSDRAFIENVRSEAVENVRRLRHHPCIALWCGNNEIEMMRSLIGSAPGSMTWAEYKRIFDKLLPDIIDKVDPDTAYWPSSPHSPHGDRRDVYKPECGDVHLWSVWFERSPFECYRGSFHRFCSEFGFQSFPDPRTVENYTLPEDRNIASYVMEHHQRSTIGNDAILQYLMNWFQLPKNWEMLIWTSQILQGLAIKYAVEHWRRNMPRCMGALYWQLNDCWPGPSWSSIDVFGRWKALHHFARRFFAPLLIQGVEDADRGVVAIHVTSDRMEECANELHWTLTDTAGEPLADGRKLVKMPARKSLKVETLQLNEYLRSHGKRSLLLWLNLAENDEAIGTNLVTFARPKHLELRAPIITTDLAPLNGGRFRVKVQSKYPALWTWITLRGTEASFSDNFFHLRPGEPREIVLTSSEAFTADRLRSQLQVKSLFDTYG